MTNANDNMFIFVCLIMCTSLFLLIWNLPHTSIQESQCQNKDSLGLFLSTQFKLLFAENISHILLYLPLEPIALFYNMGQPGLFFVYFVLFTSQFNYKWKKRRWSACDSNLGLQDGRCRRNHGAMAAPTNSIVSSAVIVTYLIRFYSL